jgi:hypothetical protein
MPTQEYRSRSRTLQGCCCDKTGSRRRIPVVYKGESCCTTVISTAQAKGTLHEYRPARARVCERHVDVVLVALLTHAPAPVITDTPGTFSTAKLTVLLSQPS